MVNDTLQKRMTPIMGWASWNCFRTNISESILKEQIDALVKTGLVSHGYTYFNIDDGFFGGRDKNGNIQTHKQRFPNGIKIMSEYAHSKNLKIGIYSDAGDNTCAYYYDNEGANGEKVGLYKHEKQDLYQYLVDWDFDFIKVDWCGGLRLGLNAQEQYTHISNIIREIQEKTGKYIVYNVCQWEFPGPWITNIADSWRTSTDISPDFNSILKQIDNAKPLDIYCGPGHTNDLDMLQIGNGMSFEEDKTHFSMWCMLSTPLLLGCDLTAISQQTLSILTNDELIAVNQDKACIQASVVKSYSEQNMIHGEIWVKDLGKKNSNQKAVAFLNRSTQPLTLSVKFSELGISEPIIQIRDLWQKKDIDFVSHEIAVTLNPHGCEVFKISC